MVTIHDINVLKEPDVFFVFLINPPVRNIFSYHHLQPEHYDTVVGPVPVEEMDCKMPVCLFKVKQWCIRQNKIKRKNKNYNGKFCNGDLVAFRKRNIVHAGIYTDHYPLGKNESNLFPLLKRRRTDSHGFMYVDYQYLNSTIVRRVLEKNA